MKTCPHCGLSLRKKFHPVTCVCGEEFDPKNSQQKYCTAKCARRDERKRRPRIKKPNRRYATDHAFRERTKLKAREYARRVRNNPIVRIKSGLRRRIRKLLKRRNINSTLSKSGLVGCSAAELMRHMESMFTPEMDWKNYGVLWVVDHIMPLSKFNLLDDKQLKRATHFSNLQPLTVELNHAKSDKVTDPQFRLAI